MVGKKSANFCCLPLSEVIICSAMVCSLPCAAAARLLLISLLFFARRCRKKEAEMKRKDLCFYHRVARDSGTFIPKKTVGEDR